MRRVVILALVCAAPGLAQWWDGPFQLTADQGADINPSVCREWLSDWYVNRTAVVWQTDRDGSWDVYARIHAGEWLPERHVGNTVLDECRPAVVCAWDSTELPSLWCAYERLDTGGITVMASRCPAGDSLWQAPEPIGGASCDSACLSAITLPIPYPDTPRVWVAWRTLDQDGWRIVCAVNDGDSWRAPQVAVEDSVELKHPRIGRGWRRGQRWYPLLVWERGGDIMASEYWQGSWTAPVEVAPSDSLDTNPEVVSADVLFHDGGAWVVWQSRRHGHWSLCAAHGDTLDTCQDWSEPGSEANDLQPSGAPANFTTDFDIGWVVYTSDRNGGSDIYSRSEHYPAVWVDTLPSTDRNPCLTVLGWTLLWCVWESDRSGNQDLFGSFIYASGVEEEHEGGGVRSKQGFPTVMRAPDFARLNCRVTDITGRDVTKQKDHLAPGVYFVRHASGVGRDASAVVRKVVIQR
jgi:hypothetical protein